MASRKRAGSGPPRHADQHEQPCFQWRMENLQLGSSEEEANSATAGFAGQEDGA
jgi:hypothetical protein